MADHFSKMLDFARQGDSGTDQEFTGEFHPDSEEVKAWQTPLSQEDNGEFQYANKSPTELRRMIEVERDAVRLTQMNKIMSQFIVRGWAIDQDDPRAIRAGEPYRGEPKKDIRPESILKMGKDVKPVSNVVGDSGGRSISDLSKSGDGMGMVKGPGGVWEEQ